MANLASDMLDRRLTLLALVDPSNKQVPLERSQEEAPSGQKMPPIILIASLPVTIPSEVDPSGLALREFNQQHG